MKISVIAAASLLFLSSTAGAQGDSSAPLNVPPASNSSSGSQASAGMNVSENLSPSAATASLNPTSSTPLSLSPAAEPVIEDDADNTANHSVPLDLTKASSTLLEKISESIRPDQDKILFSIDDNAVADKPGDGVLEVQVQTLYAELAKRTVDDDKDARQALVLAALRGDKRANTAKEEAYEDRMVKGLIKNLQAGDQSAKDPLMKYALHGNVLARSYLNLDKPLPVGLPEALSSTPKALNATASHPLSPTAAALPQILSPSAASAAPQALSSSATSPQPVSNPANTKNIGY
jgi:hypothetical protein